MFGKKKKVLEMKEYSFTQSKSFRGFKRCNMVVHGVAEYPKTEPETKDKQITFKQQINEFGESSYKVFLESTHIGSLFSESAELFNNNQVDAVYIKYETETVVGIDSSEDRIRPRLFVHIKE